MNTNKGYKCSKGAFINNVTQLVEVRVGYFVTLCKKPEVKHAFGCDGGMEIRKLLNLCDVIYEQPLTATFYITDDSHLKKLVIKYLHFQSAKLKVTVITIQRTLWLVRKVVYNLLFCIY